LAAYGIPAGSHGFRLTLDVITPFGGNPVDAYQFVTQTFLTNLRKLKDAQIKDGKVPGEYLVVYADVTMHQSVASNPPVVQLLRQRISNWTAATQPSGGGGGGMAETPYVSPMAGGFGGGGGAPVAIQPGLTLIDPRNGRDMGKDTVLEIPILVMIGPPGTITPPTPVAPAAAPGAPAPQ
jgi:hypothetical protein